MIRTSLAAVFLVAATGFAAESPLKSAKVGDFVELTTTQMVEGKKSVNVIRQTVKAVDAKEVTVTIDSTSEGDKQPSAETKYAVADYVDPGKAKQTYGPMTMEKIEEVKDEITAAGKKFQCTRYKYKMINTFGGGKIESTQTLWLSPEVPLNNVVKMTLEEKGKPTVTSILTAVGRGK